MGAEKKAQMAMSEFESALDDGDGAAALATGREILDMLHGARATIHNIGVQMRHLELTADEREAVEWFAEVRKPLARLTQSHNREKYKDTLRGLLERLG